MVAIVRGDVLSLDMKLLLAFDMLMIERSVTRAALRIGLTRQGLSGQLARMRALFGDPLFVRDGTGITPTPQAQALHPKVLAALAGLRSLAEMPLFDPATFAGIISVAATDYAIAVILPPLLRRLKTEAPRLRLAVRPLNSASIELEMRERRIDLALSIPPFMPPDLRSHHLCKERYVGVVRARHPLAGRAVDSDGFCAWPHLLVAPDKGDFHGPTDDALAALGWRRNIALVVPSFSVAFDILESSDLLAVLPQRLLAGTTHPLYIFAAPLDIEGFDLHGFWPEWLHPDTMQRRFRKVCFSSLPAEINGRGDGPRPARNSPTAPSRTRRVASAGR